MLEVCLAGRVTRRPHYINWYRISDLQTAHDTSSCDLVTRIDRGPKGKRSRRYILTKSCTFIGSNLSAFGRRDTDSIVSADCPLELWTSDESENQRRQRRKMESAEQEPFAFDRSRCPKICSSLTAPSIHPSADANAIDVGPCDLVLCVFVPR